MKFQSSHQNGSTSNVRRVSGALTSSTLARSATGGGTLNGTGASRSTLSGPIDETRILEKRIAELEQELKVSQIFLEQVPEYLLVAHVKVCKSAALLFSLERKDNLYIHFI